MPPSSRSLLVALLAGGGGGWLANALHIPGGWLIGALLAVLPFTKTGAGTGIPPWARSITMAYAGITVGAAITTQTFRDAGTLPASMLAMFVFVVLFVALNYAMQRRLWAVSSATAMSSAWPGNIMLALASADALRADLGYVSVVQALRLLLLIVVLPLTVGGVAAPLDAAPVFGRDLQIAAVIGLLCSLAARRFALPGGEVYFTAFFVGAGTLAGSLHVVPPPAVTAFFQVIVGAVVANSLSACPRSSLRASLVPALSGATLAAVLTIAVAALMAHLLDKPLAQMALAYAPGGAEGMILLAHALGVDPGFVGLHHTVRLIALTLLFPLVVRALRDPIHQATGSR